MPYLDFEKAESVLKSFCSGSTELGWKRVQRLRADFQVGWGRIGKALREFRAYVEGVCSFALKNAIALELENLELADAIAGKQELEKMLAENKDFLEILNDGQLKMELYVHHKAKALRARRTAEQPLDSELSVLQGYFWAIAEGSYQVLAAIDESAVSDKKSKS